MTDLIVKRPFFICGPSYLINFKSMTKRAPIFVGIAGGTASGKTTVCEMIFQRVRVGSDYK